MGDKISNVSPAAGAAGIRGTHTASAQTWLAAISAYAAAPAADDAAIMPVSARFWIGWHIRLPVMSIGQYSSVISVFIRIYQYWSVHLVIVGCGGRTVLAVGFCA